MNQLFRSYHEFHQILHLKRKSEHETVSAQIAGILCMFCPMLGLAMQWLETLSSEQPQCP